MALSILDGNQTATTLSTILTSGAHIPAHTVVSLGTQAKSDITSAISGSVVSISNFPSTQTIAGTVTANVFGQNVNGGSPVALPIAFGNDNFPEEGPRLGVQLLGNDGLGVGQGSVCILPISGTVTANVAWQAGEFYPYRFDGDGAPDMGTAVVFQKNDYGAAIVGDNNPLPISGTVTVGNSVTIGSLPVQLSTTTIGGTSRLNVTLSSATTVGATAPSYGNLSGGSDGTNFRAILTDTSGRTVVTVSNFPSTQPVSLASLPSLAAGTAQIGSVTASISGTVPVSGTFWQATQPVSGTVTATIASTTVTVSALPSGALTTRFGSVTTANTAQITSAVTNTSRKYLLAQNISAGTVTIGIGFSPTTTQGIQLTAGAGLTFDAFCPTGAVYWLGAVTGATWTILEG